jgi:predicted RNA-binding protein with PIN domain
MPYLIDGHNLIPKIPGLNLGDIDVEVTLILLLQEFCRRSRKQVDVYFDNAPSGNAQTRKYGRVTAHFIHQGRTADTAIRSRLRKIGKSAQNWTVVTSDREVAIAAKEAKARTISAGDFARAYLFGETTQEASTAKDADLTLNLDEVEDWLKIFKVDNHKTR